MTHIDDNAEIEAAQAAFAARCEAVLTALFTQAQQAEEVQFALALSPESRGAQDPGWNTAVESMSAVREYYKLISATEDWRMRTRLMLSLYAHLSEASGLYEIPKNMLRLASGEGYNTWPFQHLTEARSATANIIAPNATKVMKDLISHSVHAGHPGLRDLILETFDFDLRNGYAHADYIVWQDGVRLRKRNGGRPRVVAFDDLVALVNRALAFFLAIEQVSNRFIISYDPPKELMGRFTMDGPLFRCRVEWNPEQRTFKISAE